MKKSFFLNQIVLLFGVIFTLSVLTMGLVGNSMRRTYRERTEKELTELSTAFAFQVQSLLVEENTESVGRLLSAMSRHTDKRVTVFSSDGSVIADSEFAQDIREDIDLSPDFQHASRGEIDSSLDENAPGSEQRMYVSVPLNAEGKVVGVLRASVALGELNRLLGEMRLKVFFIALFVFFFSLGAAFFSSRRFSNTVRQLNDAAKRLAHGDFRSKVFLQKRDQLKELADNYNTITDKIRLYVEDISRQRGELNSIISAIHPGLLVLDREGRIKINNKSMETIVHKRDLQGHYYWQVLKEPELFDLIQYVQERKKNRKDELRIEGHCYRVNVDHLMPLNETVLVFHDITDMKNVENIKRDLVVNVSHELRTPLTAIKGYAETIEGIDQENNQYLEIIKRHTDRLIKIVEDLLILNELEEGGNKVEKEFIDLGVLVEQVLKIFESRISEKKLKLQIQSDGHVPLIQGDLLKLEQVFINLIDNAIKYTDKGEIKITLAPEDEYIRAEIQDTGIGIPAVHIPRIFERFYTVNKSRSRQLGGTGLGLSIVKHIVNLHGGSVELSSTIGEGNTFIVKLPLSG
jgi:two-component system phosphate regulon sensor histidine kinase PhoR